MEQQLDEAVLCGDLQDFLNGVCTHIIWLTKQKLTYYTGNYDTFCKTVKENEVIQQKKYEKEQDDIKHLKAFISSCGKCCISWLNSAGKTSCKQCLLLAITDCMHYSALQWWLCTLVVWVAVCPLHGLGMVRHLVYCVVPKGCNASMSCNTPKGCNACMIHCCC